MIVQDLSDDLRVSNIQLNGSISAREFADYQQSVIARNNTEQWASFVDCSLLTALDLNFERISGHADSVNRLNSGRRPGFTEIIFAPTDLGFGIARMYQTLADGQFEVRVFRTIEAAQEALAVLLDGDAA